MCAPGSTGQLRLFIGDRAHIPMYITLSRSSCTQAHHLPDSTLHTHMWHTVEQPNRERIVEAVAVPSHFPQVVLPQTPKMHTRYNLEFSNAMVRNRWQSPNQRHHSKAPLVGETLWWCTIVVRAPPGHHGGINQLLAEQIRAPGSRRVLASQGPDSTRVKPILRSCLP